MAKVRIIFPIIFSTTSCIFLLKNIDFTKIDFKTVEYKYLIIVTIALISGYIVRSYFYKFSLQIKKLKLKNLFIVTAIYNQLSSIIPFGLGHLSYIYLLRKYYKVYSLRSLHSLFMYNLLKSTTISMILFLALLKINIDWNIFHLKSLIGILITLMICTIIFYLGTNICKKNTNTFLSKKLNLLLTKIVEEVKLYKNLKLFILLIIFISMNVFISMLYLYFCYKMFGIKLPMLQLCVIFGISNISILLPIHGFGRVGSYELINTGTLVLLGYEKNVAIQVSFEVHFLELFLQTLIGSICYFFLYRSQ